jgi:hypothetical protein
MSRSATPRRGGPTLWAQFGPRQFGSLFIYLHADLTAQSQLRSKRELGKVERKHIKRIHAKKQKTKSVQFI